MQHPLPVMAVLVVPLFLAIADLNAQSPSLSATPDIKLHSVGNVRRVVSNGPLSRYTYKGAVCEYPRDGGMDNMIAGYPVLEIASHTPVEFAGPTRGYDLGRARFRFSRHPVLALLHCVGGRRLCLPLRQQRAHPREYRELREYSSDLLSLPAQPVDACQQCDLERATPG